ncbi:cryptochrome/photolyase family protein [uncultured Hyphomonas sp.]|uniref:cryptochrome/photolyase family protein n=1 Tax=uncultured Hyphomonas sp. TaxID=225298 RepID=UPI002AAC08A2|nr:cryptochrome/photolyase family protein [uncultured Hyphomonas sp.]
MTDLVFILGDQLSPSISSLKATSRDSARILMAEVMEEASYVPHHKKKIAFLFSAMRHFAEGLREDGWTVDYVRLDDDGNSGSFTGELKRAIDRHGAERILVTEPGEWRVRQDMEAWAGETGLPVEILEDDRFLCSHEDFRDWAEGRKELRMEYFYREMRRKTGLLMENGEPAGGKWNYDAENRKPAKASLFMPKPHRVKPDPVTEEVLALVADRFANNFGDLEPFWFAVTAEQAETARDHFITEALPDFGDYQDAMLAGEKFLYHSLLSVYINAGLLDPLETCRMAEAAWKAGDAPLNAVEGFIRQIIGWREYVRGIYWLKMPGYLDMNFFAAERPLPEFYWTGDTDMTCLNAAVTQTKEEAYAHHIQRLMLTGNFALLAGIDPKAVHEWYLAVYADAYEWVELPNTLGMSQYADGGLLGTKPYAAGGNYISRMSDYCDGCRYDVKLKTGPDACPFNSLYWDFVSRNADKLRTNPRMARVYSTWDRLKDDKKAGYLDTAANFLSELEGY